MHTGHRLSGNAAGTGAAGRSRLGSDRLLAEIEAQAREHPEVKSSQSLSMSSCLAADCQCQMVSEINCSTIN